MVGEGELRRCLTNLDHRRLLSRARQARHPPFRSSAVSTTPLRQGTTVTAQRCNLPARKRPALTVLRNGLPLVEAAISDRGTIRSDIDPLWKRRLRAGTALPGLTAETTQRRRLPGSWRRNGQISRAARFGRLTGAEARPIIRQMILASHFMLS